MNSEIMKASSVNDSTHESNRDRPQFSIRSLLLITAGAGAYIWLISALDAYKLLDTIAYAAGFYAVACLLLAVSGFCMMVVNIVLGRGGSIWSTGLLLVGVAYGVANIGVFVVTISADRFAIFDRAYIISVAFVGPALMMVPLIIVAGFFKRLGWLGILGFATWIGCVGFAHLWVIAAASASV